MSGKIIVPFTINDGWSGKTFKKIESLCSNSSVKNEMSIVFGNYHDNLVASGDEINSWIKKL